MIRDQKSLPWATYQHIQKYKLPPYQWTAIDPYTKTKFLAYSYEKSFPGPSRLPPWPGKHRGRLASSGQGKITPM